MLNTFILLQAEGGGFMTIEMMLIFAMIFVFYFFMIRPQQKKAKEQDLFLDNLKKGDQVVTSSGMIGKIAKIEGSIITISLDGKTTARFTKGAISKEMTDAFNAVHEKSNSVHTKV